MSTGDIRLLWQPTPTIPPLQPDAVHLWAVDLKQASSHIQSMGKLLSVDEHTRAAKFHFDQDRDFYIVGRGILRTLLGFYLQISPQALSFVYGEYGKPALAGGQMKFNLSHAYGVALLGFTLGREIGVDVERVRLMSDADRVARRSFSEEEYSVWTAVAGPQKMQAFFNCWTRKEAYIKATGEGLACPLGSFAVSLRPQEPAALLHVNGSRAEAAKWGLQSVDPAPHYVGAVLVAGDDWCLSQFAWTA